MYQKECHRAHIMSGLESTELSAGKQEFHFVQARVSACSRGAVIFLKLWSRNTVGHWSFINL